jgi:hypothetical protein
VPAVACLRASRALEPRRDASIPLLSAERGSPDILAELYCKCNTDPKVFRIMLPVAWGRKIARVGQADLAITGESAFV